MVLSNKRYSFIDGDYQVKEVVNEDGVEKEIIPDGTSYNDENGNKIVVPAGFKIVSNADTNNATLHKKKINKTFSFIIFKI